MSVRCQSGQMDQTVNLTAYAFGGSNPSLTNNENKCINSYYEFQGMVKHIIK